MKFSLSQLLHLSKTRLGTGSSPFCLTVKRMGFLLTLEYCERAGRGQASLSLSLSTPQPLYLFCARLFGLWGCFQLVLLEGGLSSPKPLPEEARPVGSPPDPRLDLLWGGEGDRTGSELPRSCRPPVRAQKAGSSTRPAPQLRALQVKPSFPAERAGEGHPLPAARPRSPGCAAAPRPWLRAGGGRTRRKSCESAASLGARAAPGAARSRATRLQVRRGGTRGPGGARGLGASRARPSAPTHALPSTAAALEAAWRGD